MGTHTARRPTASSKAKAKAKKATMRSQPQKGRPRKPCRVASSVSTRARNKNELTKTSEKKTASCSKTQSCQKPRTCSQGHAQSPQMVTATAAKTVRRRTSAEAPHTEHTTTTTVTPSQPSVQSDPSVGAPTAVSYLAKLPSPQESDSALTTACSTAQSEGHEHEQEQPEVTMDIKCKDRTATSPPAPPCITAYARLCVEDACDGVHCPGGFIPFCVSNGTYGVFFPGDGTSLQAFSVPNGEAVSSEVLLYVNPEGYCFVMDTLKAQGQTVASPQGGKQGEKGVEAAKRGVPLPSESSSAAAAVGHDKTTAAADITGIALALIPSSLQVKVAALVSAGRRLWREQHCAALLRASQNRMDAQEDALAAQIAAAHSTSTRGTTRSTGATDEEAHLSSVLCTTQEGVLTQLSKTRWVSSSVITESTTEASHVTVVDYSFGQMLVKRDGAAADFIWRIPHVTHVDLHAGAPYLFTLGNVLQQYPNGVFAKHAAEVNGVVV